MKDKPIEANRLLTIWATPDGKARATEINTPAAEHFLDMSGAYPALLAEILLKEAIALQLQAIAKEENATKEAVFQAFIQELAAELRISDAQINADTQPQFTGAVSPVQGTPLATVCMNDDGHLNVAINPDIGAIMDGHNPSDSRINICRYGAEALLMVASRLAAEQIEAGEALPEVIEHLLACLSKGLQTEIPDLCIESGFAEQPAPHMYIYNEDNNEKNNLPS